VCIKCGVMGCARECSTESDGYRPHCMVALKLIIFSSSTNLRYY